jgi:RimJ/RimL family protein N-acetyltransferase
MPIEVREGAVTLRPFRGGEFARLWAEETRDRGAFDEPWSASDEAAKARVRERVERSGTWRDRRVLDLAIEVDGELAGDVQARCDPSYEPPGLFELGISLFADRRGGGSGTVALRLITAYLFDEEHAVRVSLSTDVDNVAMRRAAERAGFTFEGVMRGFWQVPDAAPRDFALYARTLADHRR